MIRLSLIGLCLFTVFARAETQFVFGAASYHWLGTTNAEASNFRNKWSKDGRLIGTPLFAIEKVYQDQPGEYSTIKYFFGQNSMGGVMAGIAGSSGYKDGLFSYGGLLGIYAQDGSPFYRKSLTAGGIPIGSSLNIPALIGGEIIYGSAVKWHLVATPTLGLTYLSFTF